jgi:predicted alpha/beta hydrolase
MAVTYRREFVDNHAGWQLCLHRFCDPLRLDPSRRPVVLVPGFAMNSFALRYRPGGASLATFLAGRGFEVWCAELRAQGDSRPTGPVNRATIGLMDLGVHDLGVAIDAILERTATTATTVDGVGASLGATYLFMQAAWGRGDRLARLVNLGGPLRWVSVHPLILLLSQAPPIWRWVGFRGTRGFARHALPLAARVPGFLHVYLHPAICDLSEPASLVQTVDDPVPQINQEIARWIRGGDLVLQGRNLTRDSAHLRLPLLTVVANADGIVPEATVCSAHNLMTQAPRQLVYAGDHRTPMAHADLFVSRPAEAQVFMPLAAWLASELAVAKQSERATGPASAAERRGNPPDSLPFSAADASGEG